jgi:serine/threonine-protein kinase
MVTDEGRAVILDFGLAKLIGGLDLTKTGSTVGTAFYMAPEQIRGEEVDARADLWSLGVVFYQMLTGTRPFDGDYEQAVSYAILQHEPDFQAPALSGLRHG